MLLVPVTSAVQITFFFDYGVLTEINAVNSVTMIPQYPSRASSAACSTTMPFGLSVDGRRLKAHCNPRQDLAVRSVFNQGTVGTPASLWSQPMVEARIEELRLSRLTIVGQVSVVPILGERR